MLNWTFRDLINIVLKADQSRRNTSFTNTIPCSTIRNVIDALSPVPEGNEDTDSDDEEEDPFLALLT